MKNMYFQVVGWGLNEHERYSENLTTTNLPFISHKRCVGIMHENFQRFVTNDKFCAGTKNGKYKLNYQHFIE